MRFDEAALCVLALVAPMASLAVCFAWWTPVLTLAVFSLPVIRLVGWLVDTR